MQSETVSGSSILTPGLEVVFCTLTAPHEFIEVVVNPNGDNRALGSKWRLYELLPAGPALIWEGTITQSNLNRADRITPAIGAFTPYSGITAGGIVELRAIGVSTIGPTLVPAFATLTGYDPSCCGPAPNPFAPGSMFADYVVVGLGTSGCPVARYLTEDMVHSVIALEAGDNFGADPLVLNPFGDDPQFANDPKYHFPRMVDGSNSELAPHLFSASNPRLYTEGKMWGGSSGHNAGRAARGSPDVYNSWGVIAPQWLYTNLLPLMLFMESYSGNAPANPAQRGSTGPLFIIQEPPALDPVATLIVAMNTAANIATVDDYNDPSTGDCVLSATELFANPDTFERSWSQSAFLPPSVVANNGIGVGGRKLTIVSRSTVQKILWDTSGPVPRAIGVRTLVQSNPPKFVDVYAKIEVILCAGSIADPAILQRSGIGDPAILTPLGIPIIVSNANVGSNLQTHYAPFTRIPVDMGNIPPFQAVIAFSDLSGTNLPAPDGIRRAQFVSFVNVVNEELVYESSNHLLRTSTDGVVQITSTDPQSDPLVRFNVYQGIGGDTAAAIALLKVWANISLAYSGQMPTEPPAALYPSAEYGASGGLAVDDVELQEYATKNTSIDNHACGTCKMGTSVSNGVVDGSLKVFGVDGLSVSSNAIQPTITTGNTAYPAYIIGMLKAKMAGGATPY